MRGKLIVIEGSDGSGKTTQSKLLVDYLQSQHTPVLYVEFPRYQSFYGKIVARFLRGEFGNIDQVSPYLASLAYALDRASSKQQIENFLQKGGVVITNRYAISNMAHQGAKFQTKEEQEEYLQWVYELEYTVHKIPKENVVIYLHVPPSVGKTLTDKKGKRSYLRGKTKDIHEKDWQYRTDTEKMYLALAKRYKHWVTIRCVENNTLLTPQSIHQKIIRILKKRNIG